MKYFKQQQKYGHTYIVPPAEKYTVCTRTDVCIADLGPAPLEWITSNRINAFLIGTALMWGSKGLGTPGIGLYHIAIYRFRDLTAKSFFMMTFNGETPAPNLFIDWAVDD